MSISIEIDTFVPQSCHQVSWGSDDTWRLPPASCSTVLSAPVSNFEICAQTSNINHTASITRIVDRFDSMMTSSSKRSSSHCKNDVVSVSMIDQREMLTYPEDGLLVGVLLVRQERRVFRKVRKRDKNIVQNCAMKQMRFPNLGCFQLTAVVQLVTARALFLCIGGWKCPVVLIDAA